MRFKMSDMKNLLTDSEAEQVCHKWDHNSVWKGVKVNSAFCTNVCKYHKDCEVIGGLDE